MNKRIKIFDTTLRDGEQSPGISFSLEQKTRIALALEDLGVDRIEAGFPVSSPQQFNAVKKVASSVKKATVVALARCKTRDIDSARESLQGSEHPLLHLFMATSPIHRKFKLKLSKKKILAEIASHITYGRRFFQYIEFSAEDASRTEPEFLYQVIRTAIKYGATTVNIPDTVGFTVPEEFNELIRSINRNVPEVKDIDLSVHCHNDLGLAVANSLASVSAGVTQVEVTLNGIGERAGNCPLEEFVMALNVRKDVLNCSSGILTPLLFPTARMLQSFTGMIIPRNKPIIGENVFLHESGVHQDGVIKNPQTYEIMKPEHVGRTSETLVMGKHSGKSSFLNKLDQFNIKLNEQQFNDAYTRFEHLADRKKEVYDEDLIHIAFSVLGRVSFGYQLVYFHTVTGNSQIPTTTVKLKKGKKELVASNTGDGPVDAFFKAIETATGINTRLKEYIIQAIGAGKDAQGQVKLLIEINKKIYSGRATSTDIIEASGMAFVNALNNYLIRSIKDEELMENVI